MVASAPPSLKPRVLVVDDAAEIRLMVSAALSRDGSYSFAEATSGSEAIDAARSFRPDVVVLDLGLPDIDGVEVCRELRTFTDAYVLMLTGRDEEVDRLVGLAVGADDYMTKPFSPRELAARIQVLLRRPRSGGDVMTRPVDDAIVIGDVRINQLSREIYVDDVPLELTKIEFDLLATLASRPEMVFTRQQIIDTVWGDDWFGSDHMISVHIANLRKKLDANGVRHIKTVRGVGYRMA
ncbi:MAG: response regulator transcription factor [Actinomycetota bacterium]